MRPLKEVLLLAPTGVAAVNIDGTTIHSGLGIYSKIFAPLSDKSRASFRIKLSEVTTVIIDEISMVSDVLLKDIHVRICEITGVNTAIPFAGKTVLAVGDFFQLPPVMGKPVYFTSTFVEKVLKLWDNFKMTELTQVMRQQGDDVNQFVDLLNRIRIANMNPEDDVLQAKFVSENGPNYPIEAIHLFAENKPVNDHNAIMLARLDRRIYTIEAIDEVPNDIPQFLVNQLQNRKITETGGLASKLIFKLEARVMLTVNLDIQDKLINGQIGVVKNVVVTDGRVSKIYVKFFDERAGLQKMMSDTYGRFHQYVPIERTDADIAIHNKKLSAPKIKRTQFPSTLSWATTVHKVQGLEVPKAIISFSLQKQRQFNCGQMYTAISRVKFLTGLYFTGNYNKNAIKTDPRAFAKYEHKRKECPLPPPQTLGKISSDTLLVLLLNIRSLQLHLDDVIADSEIMESDVISFTETQFLPGQKVHINSFDVCFNNNGDKFRSIACAVKNSTTIVSHQKYPGFSLVQINKQLFDYDLCIGILYRKHTHS